MAETPLIPDFVMNVLRCPQTQSRLRLATEHELAGLNAAMEAGRLHNELGQRIDERLEGALLNEDVSLAYPIRFSIPVMLADEAIAMKQLQSNDEGVEHTA